MIKVDLITGFLGSGKTTFIKKYATYLVNQGYKIGIIENDFGAVNVDMMLLQDALGDRCDLEMIAGGCDRDCHQRRFKTKMISLGMLGYDRVIIEPSGIYDVDEFFDTLHEEPLDNWYEISNVITIVDAKLERQLSKESNYLLASEIANAGKIIISRSQESNEQEIDGVIEHINEALTGVQCHRQISKDEVITKDWSTFTDLDYQEIMNAGYNNSAFRKLSFEEDEAYNSLYFMNVHISVDALKEVINHIMNDDNCGHVFRVKGFMPIDGKWIEVNATQNETVITDITVGQEIIIVIGEELNKDMIQKYLNEAK